MKTKAIVFPKVNTYEVKELTLPNLGSEDISVRTLVSAISPGTERWILRGKHAGTQFPCVPGYHRIGIVEARGENVRDLEVGDVVYGSAGSWEETDIVSMWAAHVGHSVGPANGYTFLSATLPNRFELETVAFTILAGVANRGIRALEIDAHQSLLIIGAGMIGICAAQLAALRGATALLIDKDPARVAFVKSIGLQAVNIEDEDLDTTLDSFAPGGFDMLQDTVGHPGTIDQLVQKLKQGGKLLLQAQYFDKETNAIDLDQIKIKELTVKTSCNIDAQDMFETLTNIRTRRLRIAPLITHRFNAPDELCKGYELFDKGTEFNLGIVFNWS